MKNVKIPWLLTKVSLQKWQTLYPQQTKALLDSAAARLVKIALGMWVPNSERGHKIPSLEGENEIPHIPVFDFWAF